MLEMLTNLPYSKKKIRFPLEISVVNDPDKYEIRTRIIPNLESNQQVNREEVENFNSEGSFKRPITQVEYWSLLAKVIVLKPMIGLLSLFEDDEKTNPT